MSVTDEIRGLLDEYVYTLGLDSEMAADPHGCRRTEITERFVTRIANAVKVERTAKAIAVAHGAIGSCKCGRCGECINPWDSYCRNCGARIEEVDGWSR